MESEMRGAKGAHTREQSGSIGYRPLQLRHIAQSKPPYIDSTRGEVGDRKSIEGNHGVCCPKSAGSQTDECACATIVAQLHTGQTPQGFGELGSALSLPVTMIHPPLLVGRHLLRWANHSRHFHRR